MRCTGTEQRLFGCGNRLVALWVGGNTLGVMATTDNPTDLFWTSQNLARLFGVASVVACLAVAIWPHRRKTLSWAGFPVVFWVLRGADFAQEGFRGERSWAAMFIHLALGGLLYAFWSLAVQYEILRQAMERLLDDIEEHHRAGE